MLDAVDYVLRKNVMMTAIKRRVLFFPLLVLSLHLCRAQAPSGPINFSFDTNTPVFDLTGTYQLDQQMLGASGASNDLAFAVALVNDVHGGLRGAGSTVVDIGNGASLFAGNYTVRGRVSGGAGHPTRVTLHVHLVGQDTVLGTLNTHFSVSVQYELVVDPGTLTLAGTSRGQAAFGGIGSSRIRGDIVPVPLSPSVDGTWAVQMDVVTLDKIGGSGTIFLPNGRTFQMDVSGHYSASQNLARTRLMGINGSQGTTLNLNFTSPNVVESFTGRILGQTVRF